MTSVENEPIPAANAFSSAKHCRRKNVSDNRNICYATRHVELSCPISTLARAFPRRSLFPSARSVEKFRGSFFLFFPCNPLKLHETTKEKLGESKEKFGESKEILGKSKKMLGGVRALSTGRRPRGGASRNVTPPCPRPRLRGPASRLTPALARTSPAARARR